VLAVAVRPGRPRLWSAAFLVFWGCCGDDGWPSSSKAKTAQDTFSGHQTAATRWRDPPGPTARITDNDDIRDARLHPLINDKHVRQDLALWSVDHQLFPSDPRADLVVGVNVFDDARQDFRGIGGCDVAGRGLEGRLNPIPRQCGGRGCPASQQIPEELHHRPAAADFIDPLGEPDRILLRLRDGQLSQDGEVGVI